MANEKNIINELVSEGDDTIPGNESLADTYDYIGQQQEQRENRSIFQLKADLRKRSRTIERLQYDIEQLRARWTGLDTEIRAREQMTSGLNEKLDNAVAELARKQQLLEERDRVITSLEAKLRDSGGESGEYAVQRQAGRLTSAEVEIRELRTQLERTETYADDIRRQLQERMSLSTEVEDTKEHLQLDLRQATGRIAKLESELEQTQSSSRALREELAAIESKHAEEIRIIRFELGEAQETVTQHELMTEQLASDLVDTRTFRQQLERTLVKSEKASQSQIERLERENRHLKGELEHYEEQLSNKNDAINCLLAELATKSQQIESVGEIEEVIQEIDDRVSDRINEPPRSDRGRMSRVLIGTIDGQELRFPLFKDRLTIGRTNQNDIQLKASYVSRRHAVVVTDQASTRVIDWGSRNGVFVNGEQITEHFLRNGDKVKVGTAEFRYEERAKRDA